MARISDPRLRIMDTGTDASKTDVIYQLFDLPWELRDTIWSFLIDSVGFNTEFTDTQVSFWSFRPLPKHDMKAWRALRPFRLTCRQASQEVLDAVFRTFTLRIRLHTILATRDAVWTNVLGKLLLQRARTVEILVRSDHRLLFQSIIQLRRGRNGWECSCSLRRPYSGDIDDGEVDCMLADLPR